MTEFSRGPVRLVVKVEQGFLQSGHSTVREPSGRWEMETASFELRLLNLFLLFVKPFSNRSLLLAYHHAGFIFVAAEPLPEQNSSVYSTCGVSSPYHWPPVPSSHRKCCNPGCHVTFSLQGPHHSGRFTCLGMTGMLPQRIRG